MKRHVQEPGVRRWFANDLLELQSEPLKAIEGLLNPYESCVLSGCAITGTTTKAIGSGLILFVWVESGVRKSIVAEFSGATGLTSSFTRYLYLAEETISRVYQDGQTKPIVIYKKAVISASQPAEPFVVITQNGVQKTFRDAIQSASYRFVTDSEKSTWNNKLNASEVVTTAAANKVLKLNGSSQFPATVIAQTSSLRFVTDTEKSTWNNKATTDVATTSVNGLMSSGDKTKLNGIATNANNYVHPSTHPHSMITGLGSAATRAVGTTAGNVMKVGAFGLGGYGDVITDFNSLQGSSCRFIRVNDSDLNAPPGGSNYYSGFHIGWATGGNQQGWQMVNRISSALNAIYVRTKSNLTEWQQWVQLLHTGNFTDNSSNWNQAYNWGNHANAGYLTSLPSHNHSAANITSGTLDDARLPSTMSSKTFSGPITVGNGSFVPHLSFVRNGNNVIYANGGTAATLAFITGNKSISTSNFSLFIDSNSRVGVNKASCSYDFDVTGSIRATANILADSDRRLKTKIKPLQGALNKVMQLEGVSFDWKKGGKKSIGVIAQDIQKILPEVVLEGKDGFLSVNYQVLTALLIEAVKELATKN